MDAISTAINKIMFTIPQKLLQLGYITKYLRYSIQTTIEKQITDLVIERIVLLDTNLVGGITESIPLESCIYKEFEKNPAETNYVITVPMDVTGGRKVIEPLSLVSNATETGYNVTTNEILNYASNLVNNLSMTNTISITNLELIATNTILVHDPINFLGANTYLNVMLEHDSNLSRLSPRSYNVFSELCIEATKWDLYRRLIEDIDTNLIYNGFELGRLGETLESYADAYDRYKEILETKWSKVLFMNNTPAMNNFIKDMINPAI